MNSRDSQLRPLATWIALGIVMLVVQVLLGGITRLTGSGLSITEWNIVTGTLPPLSGQAWQEEFLKYQQTPQYQLLNFDFTLENFKFIFFWEWLHRFWARLIGVVFLAGFLYLSIRRLIPARLRQPLLILFLLGALQGAVGWIMVLSGLTGDAIYVRPTRLALHFIFAIGLIAYACWVYFGLRINPEQRIVHRGNRRLIIFLLLLAVLQLLLGALMAGHRAASAAPTWPGINGYLIPSGIFSGGGSWLTGILENRITIHFLHRNLAMLLVLGTLVLTFRLCRLPRCSAVLKVATLGLPLFVLAQALLGILSVLSSPQIVPGVWGLFEWLAQFHQLVGMGYFLNLLLLLYLVRRSA